MSSNVTHAEINEAIEINCTESNNLYLVMYYPDYKCATANQCTETGKCNVLPSSICSCCVQPKLYCNAQMGKLSFTVLINQPTFFGMWSCRQTTSGSGNCATVVIQQYGTYKTNIITL